MQHSGDLPSIHTEQENGFITTLVMVICNSCPHPYLLSFPPVRVLQLPVLDSLASSQSTRSYPAMKKTWLNTRLYCMQHGGNLPSIHSEQENGFITTLVKHQSFVTII